MINRIKHLVLTIVFSHALLSLAAGAEPQRPFRNDRILVKPSRAGIAALHAQHGNRVLRSYPHIGNIQVVELPKVVTVEQAIALLETSGLVEYAEPDYMIEAAGTPNDPKFTDGTLWGLHNIGQNGGTADADIDAPEGWDKRTTANDVIVAVIDSGVRYTHQDLAANMWINPGEGSTANGVDDDANGIVDDIHGMNAILVPASGDPNDDYHHGTPCCRNHWCCREQQYRRSRSRVGRKNHGTQVHEFVG